MKEIKVQMYCQGCGKEVFVKDFQEAGAEALRNYMFSGLCVECQLDMIAKMKEAEAEQAKEVKIKRKKFACDDCDWSPESCDRECRTDEQDKADRELEAEAELDAEEMEESIRLQEKYGKDATGDNTFTGEENEGGNK